MALDISIDKVDAILVEELEATFSRKRADDVGEFMLNTLKNREGLQRLILSFFLGMNPYIPPDHPLRSMIVVHFMILIKVLDSVYEEEIDKIKFNNLLSDVEL